MFFISEGLMGGAIGFLYADDVSVLHEIHDWVPYCVPIGEDWYEFHVREILHFR